MLKGFLGGVIFAIVVTAGVYAAADWALSVPSVHVAHGTGKCVAVHNHDSVLFGTTEYTCDNMPTRYNLVRVAAR